MPYTMPCPIGFVPRPPEDHYIGCGLTSQETKQAAAVAERIASATRFETAMDQRRAGRHVTYNGKTFPAKP
jgi:hypothetical protein